MVRRLTSAAQTRWGLSRSAFSLTHRRRHFVIATRPLFIPSTSPSSPTAMATDQAVVHQGEVVTRLGPSVRLPGLQGVFVTRPLKKFQPLEVLPMMATATRELSDSITPPSATSSLSRLSPTSKAHEAEETESLQQPPTTLAPPLVLNLAFAPRHHISLRRFLALRHMLSTSDYLHVATDDGWYLVAPSTAAPLCPDVEGLQRWVRQHHRRYLTPSAKNSMSSSAESSPRAVRLAKHASLARLEAALDNGEELTAAELQAMATIEKEEQHAADAEGAEEEDGEEKDDEEDKWSLLNDATQRVEDGSSSAQPLTQTSNQLRTLPPLIPETHLFAINDGVAWPLPPKDDLANHDYWKGHRQRMALYESSGDVDAAAQKEALLDRLKENPRAQSASEQELHAAAEALYQVLKHKANAVLSVETGSGLLTLVPLRDLEAGEEVLLHYGREWWTGRLLSPLMLAVSDAQLPQVRWIEQLFGHMTDKNELFPWLIPAHQQRRRRSGHRRDRHANLSGADAQAPRSGDSSSSFLRDHQKRGPVVLYNAVTRGRATDAAALAFAVRRSCVDDAFFHGLVVGDAARGLTPLFRVGEPDAEMPLKRLRKALLASLRGVEEIPSAPLQQAVMESASEKAGIRSKEAAPLEDDPDNEVFSV